MKNIENLIVEFVKHIDIVDYICLALGLLLFFFPIYIVILKIRKEKDKKEKKHKKIFLVFYLCFYVGLISLLARNQFEKKNTSIESLNNKYNVFIQENNNIELYYVPKNEEVIKEIDSIKKSQFKIVIEKTKDEKYYISFHKPTDAFDILKFKEDRRKEVKKEDLKDFIKNIKQQDNYKGTGKHEKLTLEDLE